MEDPAVLLARPDLDLVGLRVEQDDRVLVVDAGREKNEFIVDASFSKTKTTFNDSRSLENQKKLDKILWHLQCFMKPL